ncbi:o-succinylbenzoate synthase [Capnocytophaga endodontalis]|uniref:O-succinylbenzoate synthase n=1 Tax=Capnocytophaga endodontalis TaxID=2708117 RepID=A0A1Z4BRE6_9FLAO|nr:o-succinylbenzoate synthase [Capnocytophaga endodontalis]ASF43874.1 o-succinylbenzoate synthase [Capnocytophaga endodontalis]
MIKHILNFKRPSGTSRGVLTSKETFFLVIEQEDKKGIGECNLFRGLSADDVPDYEAKLQWVEQHLYLGEEALLKELVAFPSIQFGVEQAFRSVAASQWYELFPSDFTTGKDAIPINGLIWMGSPDFMKAQIKEKLAHGFRCIKMKIGAIDFEEEYRILKALRNEFSASDIEIRVDANGAFQATEALVYLERLAALQLHSIEQPIRAGQWEAMAELCEQTPLPIALDEELIGVFTSEEKQRLLREIQPQYIILKPSLIGGYRGSEEWITLAETLGIGWWVTSALESNIGLNAIAQWTYTLHSPMPQGLGTGALYTNNLPFPLYVENGHLGFNPCERVTFPFS